MADDHLKQSTFESDECGISDQSKTDKTLSPLWLSEYVGQSRLTARLKVSIGIAKSKGEPLDHVLLYGARGLGKSTLARVIANEMGARIHITSAHSLHGSRDLVGLFHQLEEGDILFVDEIHKLGRIAEEMFCQAMDDFIIDLTTGRGKTKRTMRLPLASFTLVGATTEPNKITQPLLQLFVLSCPFEVYDPDELSFLITRTADILGVRITGSAVGQIAARARGTPKTASRLLRLVCDYAHYTGKDFVDEKTAMAALDMTQHDLSTTDN